MPRVTPITTKDQVSPEHRPVFDAVAEGRGSVRGPFSIMMYSPPMCERVLNTSNFLRFQSSVSPGRVSWPSSPPRARRTVRSCGRPT